MGRRYQVGDHVSWNSEAGHVKGHCRPASEEESQYEIKSDKTDHIAAHKGGALRKLRD